MYKNLNSRRIYYLLFLIFHLAGASNAQNANFYEHILPIFQEKCFGCHEKGKHFFLFDTYSKVRAKATMLSYVIEKNIMPPWPADDSYQSYKHSRALSQAESKLILDWFNDGLLEGEKKKLKKKSKDNVKPSKLLTITTPSIFLPVNERDTFILFEIPFSFNRGYSINQLRFKSSVLNYIHHINLFVGSGLKGLQNADFVFGYAPGMEQQEFSKGQGFKLRKTGILSGDIHIPPISKPLKLDLQVQLKPISGEIEYPLFFLGNQGFTLVNLSQLLLPKDSVIKVEGWMIQKEAVYLTHIMPHMHLLGTEIEVWAEDSIGARIPLVRINKWLFQWQNFYEFSTPIYIPAKSKIWVNATYHNTVNNLNNPFSPPRDVTEGWLSNQEMLSVFMIGYYPKD